VQLIGLYSDLHWQASSDYELLHIQRQLGAVARAIYVASDLPPACIVGNSHLTSLARREINSVLRIIFLSRISRMKNLDFLLEVLRHSNANLRLSIYGPIEDRDYWDHCQSLIASLPVSLEVVYMGEIHPSQVLNALSDSDLFVLPTRGENYGHVVLESLTAGTPVLISDQTPWQASNDGAVQALPLDDLSLWVSVIDRWAVHSHEDLSRLRNAAYNYAKQYREGLSAVESNRRLFQAALHS